MNSELELQAWELAKGIPLMDIIYKNGATIINLLRVPGAADIYMEKGATVIPFTLLWPDNVQKHPPHYHEYNDSMARNVIISSNRKFSFFCNVFGCNTEVLISDIPFHKFDPKIFYFGQFILCDYHLSQEPNIYEC